jgi:hypothetical protein
MDYSFGFCLEKYPQGFQYQKVNLNNLFSQDMAKTVVFPGSDSTDFTIGADISFI